MLQYQYTSQCKGLQRTAPAILNRYRAALVLHLVVILIYVYSRYKAARIVQEMRSKAKRGGSEFSQIIDTDKSRPLRDYDNLYLDKDRRNQEPY